MERDIDLNRISVLEQELDSARRAVVTRNMLIVLLNKMVLKDSIVQTCRIMEPHQYVLTLVFIALNLDNISFTAETSTAMECAFNLDQLVAPPVVAHPVPSLPPSN
jgi:hypothetical protein